MGWQTQTAPTQILLATSNTSPIPSGVPKAIFVTATGTVSWVDNSAEGNTHTYTLAAGVHIFQITKLLTATTVPVLGLY